jgi:AcrR family transcriptional regulator
VRDRGREGRQEHRPSSRARSDRRERRQAEIRERLVESALRLFAEHGFTATTVEDITNSADVGKGTFFNYFPSKEHVFAGRAQRQVEKVQAFVEEARDSTKPMDELLYRLAASLVEGMDSTPAIFHSILVAVSSNERVRGMMANGLAQVLKSLEELMSVGQQRGEVRDDLPAAELALGFQRAFLGSVLLWSVTPSRPLTDCLREMSSILWSAIRKGST